MEWYWILLVVAAFVGLVAMWIWLGKKGLVSTELLGTIKALVSALSGVFDEMATAIPDKSTKYLDKAWDLQEMSVYAAENMWYNKEITKEERYDKCVELFWECLTLYDVQLPEGYDVIMNGVIRAVCEKMGHMIQLEDDLVCTDVV